MLSRRTFIKFMSLVGGVVLNPFQRLVTQLGINLAVGEEVYRGELYAGFLLLPEGTIIPSFVEFPKKGSPNECGVGIGWDGIKPNAVSRFFDNAEGLAAEIKFPIYTLNNIPAELIPMRAYVLSDETGEVFGAALGFDAINIESGYWECIVSLWAQPIFPKPVPLYFREPIESGDSIGLLEKVNYLPSPGIRTQTQEGFIYYWIENDVFYTLAVDPVSALKDAHEITSYLKLMK
jgi:hypothetical protein